MAKNFPPVRLEVQVNNNTGDDELELDVAGLGRDVEIGGRGKDILIWAEDNIRVADFEIKVTGIGAGEVSDFVL